MSSRRASYLAHIADLRARAETMRRFGYVASAHALDERVIRLEARLWSLGGVR